MKALKRIKEAFFCESLRCPLLIQGEHTATPLLDDVVEVVKMVWEVKTYH